MRLSSGLALLLSVQTALAPALFAAEPPDAAAPSPTPVASPAPALTPAPKHQPKRPTTEAEAEPSAAVQSHAGWHSSEQFGIWWKRYSVTKSGQAIDQSGLVSFAAGFERDYEWDPVYAGLSLEFYTPQILWKSVGLGVFYFLCFFLSAGHCNAHPGFATGDRDAGFAGIGGHFGYDLHPLPLRFYAGPDVGLYYSPLTPYPFTAVFVKGGVAYDFAGPFSLDLSIRKSVSMAEWNLGNTSTVSDPSVTLYTAALSIGF